MQQRIDKWNGRGSRFSDAYIFLRPKGIALWMTVVNNIKKSSKLFLTSIPYWTKTATKDESIETGGLQINKCARSAVDHGRAVQAHSIF